MTAHKKLMYLSATLATAGVMGLAPYGYMWSTRQNAVANPAAPLMIKQPDPTPTLVMGKPVQLSIPSLQMDLQVADGTYNKETGEWALSTDKAHYALPTVAPNNEEGNTLIYGHYRAEVFARLHTIAPGATASIITDNGYKFTYTYTSTETVHPTNTDVFAYQGVPRLTVQTCSGAWFQNRQLYYFAYSGYEKV